MKNNRLRVLSLLFVVVCLIATSIPVVAQGVAEAVEIRTLVDDLGREVEIAYPIPSIVSLAPSISELVCAAGACDKIVGVDKNTNYPESLQDVPVVMSSFNDTNVEAIVALDPGLVIVAGINSQEQIKSLEDMGIPVYALENPKTLADIPDLFRKFGVLIDEEETMADLAEDFNKRMDVITEALDGVEAVSVFYEIDATDPNSPWTTGAGTFIDELITLAGGENIAAELDGEWMQVSIEFLVEKDPDTIVLADANYGVTAETIAARVGWEDLYAVTAGNILPMDSDIASRPGPRMIDAAEQMASFFHPEIFDNDVEPVEPVETVVAN